MPVTKGKSDGSSPSWRVEGLPPGEDPSQAKPRVDPPRMPRARFMAILLGLFVVNWMLYQGLSPDVATRHRLSYTTFRAEVVRNNVVDLTSRGDNIQGQFRESIKTAEANEAVRLFTTQKPGFARDDDVLTMLIANNVPVNVRDSVEPVALWQRLLFGFGPALVLVGLMLLLLRKMSPTMSGMGRSKAKLADSSARRTTFNDVAGIDDAEEELVEIVDFLRNPERYRRLGATIPKGVLLSGPPGTGKTLLARAVAGEAGVPFFSLSASEFVEMIVGVGASRVRDLFDTAKKAAPAIIFIDELDAIGRSRSAGGNVGGHDEREQTLNQILTEMDGFTGSEGVIVLAATNRPEILDSALMRPGRFDRRVVVSQPDLTGRKAILAVHTRNVPLGPDVDLDGLAAATPGFVGADLRNVINEAALMAARRNHDSVLKTDFTDAFEKVVLGTARKIMISPAEKRRTAYHESGHALMGMLCPGADPVRKISIIPRGRALGVTFQAPDKVRFSFAGEFGGMKMSIVVVTNGDKTWGAAMGRVADFEPEKREYTVNQTYHLHVLKLLPLVADKDFKLAAAGEKDVGGKKAAGVRVTRDKRPTVTLFFDKTTGLLVKSEATVKDEFQGWKDVPEESFFEDYKDAGGKKVFTKMRIVRDGKVMIESELSDQKWPEKLDAKTFEKP